MTDFSKGIKFTSTNLIDFMLKKIDENLRVCTYMNIEKASSSAQFRTKENHEIDEEKNRS